MSEIAEKPMIHECPGLPASGIGIIFDNQFGHPQMGWRLLIDKEATEDDLEENHYLENVGDSLWSTSVGITHCPYCGIDLYALSKSTPVAVGKFVLHDHQSWYMKVR